MPSQLPSIDIDKASVIFSHAEWIGQNKIYPPPKTLPVYIAEAYNTVFAVPTTILEQLPVKSTDIHTFINGHLPACSLAPSFSSPDAWYTVDEATTDLSKLLTCSIPHKHVLDGLHKISGQKWFDGNRSLRDFRYNSGNERFPLCAISVWFALQDLAGLRERWTQSIEWVSGHLTKFLPNSSAELTFRHTADLLSVLPYDGKLSTKQVLCCTREMTRIIGQLGKEAWLSGDLLDWALEKTRVRLAADPQVAETTVIGSFPLLHGI